MKPIVIIIDDGIIEQVLSAEPLNYTVIDRTSTDDPDDPSLVHLPLSLLQGRLLPDQKDETEPCWVGGRAAYVAPDRVGALSKLSEP